MGFESPRITPEQSSELPRLNLHRTLKELDLRSLGPLLRSAVNEGECEGKILDFIHSLGVLQRGSLPEVSGRLTKPDRMTAFSIFFA
jgi:hypothetical protein